MGDGPSLERDIIMYSEDMGGVDLVIIKKMVK